MNLIYRIKISIVAIPAFDKSQIDKVKQLYLVAGRYTNWSRAHSLQIGLKLLISSFMTSIKLQDGKYYVSEFPFNNLYNCSKSPRLWLPYGENKTIPTFCDSDGKVTFYPKLTKIIQGYEILTSSSSNYELEVIENVNTYLNK